MIPFVAAFTVFAFAAFTMAMALVLPAHHGFDPWVAWTALLVGAAAGAGAFFQTAGIPSNRRRRPPLSPWAWVLFAAFAVFAAREFCWLVYDDETRVAIGSPNNLGDLSLHLQLARFFADGAPWWPAHAEAAGQPLRYYPGADGFQALLLAVGAPERQALVWVGLLGAAAALLALYRWGGSFTVAGFLCSGGWWGFEFLRDGQFLDFQGTQAWKNLALAIFVTQRPFLFALPAGLLLLAHWREKFFAEPPPALAGAPPAERLSMRGLIPFWVEALLYAVMPLFHVFAFLFLSVLLGWWFVCYYPRPSLRRHLLILVGVALLPATYAVSLMTGGFHAGGQLMHVHWGWMQDDAPFVEFGAHHFWARGVLAPVAFWLMNFGLFALLAPALWGWCAWEAVQAGYAARFGPRPTGGLWLPQLGRARESAVAFVLPAGGVFVIACVVMFAPWEWDNTKLMIWCYLAALPFIWQTWVRPLTAPLRWPLCLLLFFSGAVSLCGGMGRASDEKLGYTLIDRAELASAELGTRALPAGARFACAPDYNHPLVFCGRPLAVGYTGHLHSQGIDYLPLLRDLQTLLRGQPGWEDAAARLDVRYVYWGPREERAFPGGAQPWADAARLRASSEWGRIYELPPRGN